MTAEPFILRVGSHRQLAKDGHSLQAMAAAWSELDSLTAQSSQILAFASCVSRNFKYGMVERT